MALTPDEIRTAHARYAHAAQVLEEALEPDADGKIRVTKAEAGRLVGEVVGASLALIVDAVD